RRRRGDWHTCRKARFRADQTWRAVGGWAAGPGARKYLGSADLQGPGQVRLTDTTCPPVVPRSTDRIHGDPIRAKNQRVTMSRNKRVGVTRQGGGAMGRRAAVSQCESALACPGRIGHVNGAAGRERLVDGKR